MISRHQKIKKNTDQNALKQSPKAKFETKYKWFKISYLEFFSWKYNFRHKTYLYSSTRSSGHHQGFILIFRFLRSLQAKKTLAKKISHFTIQFSSKNLTNFTNLNSLDIERHWNWYALTTQSKTFLTLQIFQHTFLFGVRKNICTAPFLDAREPHSWSTLIANVCIFLYIFVRKFLFQQHCVGLSDGGGLGEAE